MNDATEEQKRSIRRIKYAIWIIGMICVILGVFVYIQSLPPPAHMYDVLAQCIASSGAKFYGAFWCPHCEEQKTKFGTGAQYLPYVECSPPDAKGRTHVCIDNGITQYPTWVISSSTKLIGVQTPQTLASSTGCTI